MKTCPLRAGRSALVLLLAVLVSSCAQRAGGPSAGATLPHAARAVPVAAADARDIDAEVARILGGQHGQMPPVQQVQREAAGLVSEITSRNDTSYRLVLLYSGSTSQRLVLAPRESGTVRVQPGEYQVAARVEGGNVRPFAGRQRYEGGRYEVSWTIVSR